MTKDESVNNIVDMSKAYSNHLQDIKEYAAGMMAARTYTVTELARRLNKCIELVNARMSCNKPFAIGELILAANVSRDTWDRIRKGELDYLIVEYITLNDIQEADIINDGEQQYIDIQDAKSGEIVRTPLAPPSEIIEKFYTQHEIFLELNMYNNKSMPAVTADIFALKARHKWDDKPQDSGTVTNNNLIIADKEQAQKVVELLSKG